MATSVQCFEAVAKLKPDIYFFFGILSTLMMIDDGVFAPQCKFITLCDLFEYISGNKANIERTFFALKLSLVFVHLVLLDETETVAEIAVK